MQPGEFIVDFSEDTACEWMTGVRQNMWLFQAEESSMKKNLERRENHKCPGTEKKYISLIYIIREGRGGGR